MVHDVLIRAQYGPTSQTLPHIYICDAHVGARVGRCRLGIELPCVLFPRFACYV